MNNKAQSSIFLSIVFALFFFMGGVLLLGFVADEQTLVTSPTGLDCLNNAISDGTKLTCLFTSATVPLVILVIVSVVGGYITTRLLI